MFHMNNDLRVLIVEVALFLSLVVACFNAVKAPAQTFEISVDRSNLSLQSEAVREKTLEDIHSLGAAWFRDGTKKNSNARIMPDLPPALALLPSSLSQSVPPPPSLEPLNPGPTSA